MKIKGILVANDRLAEDVSRFHILCPEIAGSCAPGQFVNISCGDAWDSWLRRPISICDVQPEAGTLDIVFQSRGKGTARMMVFPAGMEVDLLGPLGNRFSIPETGRIAVVGGGIGIFPLLYLLRQIPKERTSCYVGFRNRETIVLEDAYRAASGRLSISTDDGSAGHHGLVTEPFLADLAAGGFDFVHTCGPLPMMRAVARACEAAGIPCEVSMEQRMGCGVGACLVCACKTREDETGDFTYRHVCKDGPIFDSRTVSLD